MMLAIASMRPLIYHAWFCLNASFNSVESAWFCGWSR